MSRSSTKCKLDSSSHPGMMTLRKRSTTLKELLANHGFVYFYLLYFFLFLFSPLSVLLCFTRSLFYSARRCRHFPFRII